jgi:hypothetical protein
VSETAAAFTVSWWVVRAALTEACLLTLPEVDELSPRMLGTDEHRFRSVRISVTLRPNRGTGTSRE